MRVYVCLSAAAVLLAGCATMAGEPALSAQRAGETCAQWAERVAPHNPQTQRRLEQDCLRERRR